MLSIVVLCLPAFAAAWFPDNETSVALRGVKGSVQMPLLGIGTWEYNDSRTEEAVVKAFQLGYRHVDTASVYGNGLGVGRALKRSGIKREEFFVTSKLAIGLNVTATVQAMHQNLEDLQLDYVDLMLIHIPPKGAGARQEQWKALEEFAKSGKARAIGVSHFCKRQIQDILSIATVPIAVNQVQYHVGMGTAGDFATDYKSWVQSQGILYQSFSPLCGPCNATNGDKMALITGDLVTGIGRKYNKTGAQVALKWLVQQGIPAIPKSDNPHHMWESIDIFDFKLSDDDMAALTSATVPPVAGGPSPQDSGDCGMEEEVLV
jgi:diketogulonate reductase-like aldo/keto reductase